MATFVVFISFFFFFFTTRIIPPSFYIGILISKCDERERFKVSKKSLFIRYYSIDFGIQFQKIIFPSWNQKSKSWETKKDHKNLFLFLWCFWQKLFNFLNFLNSWTFTTNRGIFLEFFIYFNDFFLVFYWNFVSKKNQNQLSKKKYLNEPLVFSLKEVYVSTFIWVSSLNNSIILSIFSSSFTITNNDVSLIHFISIFPTFFSVNFNFKSFVVSSFGNPWT